MENIELIRKMSSADAADWVLEKYGLNKLNYYEAFELIKKKSWKRVDQIRLARFYLAKMPFASALPYEVFASFMALEPFLMIIRECKPLRSEDINLMLYHLIPVLRKMVKTQNDSEMVAKFLADFSQES
ncbi:hypothetical protein [Chromobacterium phragmitis]|uniref:Uncharacterized protein n=1 Tax=Chromobacterium phragmitis TaxID=2202141 RepID=A0ABV0INS9_9NEIS|nr:hypothetical protein [Chromobacterium phragmitis]